ncbi:MAG: aldo/keto reductase, partial [Acidobacteria bacterium]|nr:aldo/keto reductase [Acidobacteriota bacterium]
LGTLLGNVVARSEVVLVSKAGVSRRQGRRIVDTSRRSMLASLDASLARCNTDHLDLWLAHSWDPEVPLDETLAALDYAVTSGRTRYVGVANFNSWQLATAACSTDATVVVDQVEYSLLNRHPERGLADAADHHGASLMSWAPLGRGVLTGKYRGQIPSDSRGAGDRLASYVEPYLGTRASGIVEALVTASTGLGRAPLDVALSWLLARNAVASAVVGPRTPQQLAAILHAGLAPLPAQILEVLDEVSAA